MITLVSAFVLVFLAMLGALGWILWSLNKHQRVSRPSKWQVIACMTAVLLFWDLSDSGFALRRAVTGRQSLPVPQACKDAFDRDLVVDPAQPTWAGSFTWDTRKCPNGTYQASVTALDQAGNVSDRHTINVTVLNLDRLPLTKFTALGRIYPKGGYIELITEDTKKRQFGLNVGADRFQWSLVSQNNEVWVVENQVLRSIRSAPRGSILRLSVTDGVVSYSRNGTVFYTSAMPMSVFAVVEVTVEDADTKLGALTIAGGGS